MRYYPRANFPWHHKQGRRNCFVVRGMLYRISNFQFDVTPLMRQRNELVMEVSGNPSSGGIWGEVALEVRRTAFLRGVAIRTTGMHLEVTGAVVGWSDGALELYLLVDGHQASYSTITPSTEGRLFQIVVDRDGGKGPPQSVQVDLVNGATVWYTIACNYIGDAVNRASE